jgi:hypothetical protein
MARYWGRKGRPFRKAQAECFAEETHCYFGDGPVDQTLANYRSSRARSVHHLIPPDIAPELANDRANMRLAHLGCNSKYGRGQYKGAPTEGTTTTRALRRGRAQGWRRRALVGVGAGMATVSNPDRDW